MTTSMRRGRGRGSISSAIVASGATPHRLLAAAIISRALQDADGVLTPLDRYPKETPTHYAMRQHEIITDAQRWLAEDAYPWCLLMETPDLWDDLLTERIAA